MTFEQFHAHANVQGIPLAALRTYYEAGRLSGCMEKLSNFRKKFEERGIIPWGRKQKFPPNFEQCGESGMEAKGLNVESKIIPAQFVQHGKLEKQPSLKKGPLKIKKWMVR